MLALFFEDLQQYILYGLWVNLQVLFFEVLNSLCITIFSITSEGNSIVILSSDYSKKKEVKVCLIPAFFKTSFQNPIQGVPETSDGF
jgi:hypothetical protein